MTRTAFVTDKASHVNIDGKSWPVAELRARLAAPVEARQGSAKVPEGFALTLLDRSYDQRVAAIIAHNQCKGDLDDKLDAAYRASVLASPAVRTAPASEAPPCIWTPHADHYESGGWDSACGESWTFIDGGPVDNRVRFCQGCGKSVEVCHVET